jgi:hypothetical protein
MSDVAKIWRVITYFPFAILHLLFVIARTAHRVAITNEVAMTNDKCNMANGK